MNYYERHLGDYARDTAHLTMLEHGAYTLLLDRYYTTEDGIPIDQVHRLARARTDDERAAVDSVLSEFFVQLDGKWINRRAEEEIARFKIRTNASSENGKLGGRPRKNQNLEKTPRLFLGSENETQQKAKQNLAESQTKANRNLAKAHQTPYTIHHTPVKKHTKKKTKTRKPKPIEHLHGNESRRHRQRQPRTPRFNRSHQPGRKARRLRSRSSIRYRKRKRFCVCHRHRQKPTCRDRINRINKKRNQKK